MNNNYDVQMNREANAVSVTAREFARDNKINTHVLCGLILNDSSIAKAFVRRNVNYYKLEAITKWFKNNTDSFKVKKSHNDYYCTSCGIYTTPDRKSTRYACCVGCEKKADARTTPERISKEPTMKVSVVNARYSIALKMEMRELDNLISDSWMLCE